MNGLNYHDRVNMENVEKLRELQKNLPDFCGDFFRGIEPTTSSKTRIAYAYDLRIFFEFLCENKPELKDIEIIDFAITVLDTVTPIDIEKFLEYLTYYKLDGNLRLNAESGKKRKLASLRSFYNYCYKKELIKTNPTVLVDTPKLHEKEIIRLDIDEVAKFLDEVEHGENMTQRQKVYHNKTKKRDLAMMTLLLGTGIRVSECVGLDIDDVDFDNDGIKITRKGGNEVVIYFGEEVREALLSYLEEREQQVPLTNHQNALFLSLQMRRISARSIENIVKKYSATVTKLKNITPHKLRSTYGTSLYRETGDIYLVADVLGHKDVNTTRKHYAAIEDARRKGAAGKVKLREN